MSQNDELLLQIEKIIQVKKHIKTEQNTVYRCLYTVDLLLILILAIIINIILRSCNGTGGSCGCCHYPQYIKRNFFNSPFQSEFPPIRA